MKTFFLSIATVLGSLFGFHPKTVQPPASTTVVQTASVQSTSTPEIAPTITYPSSSDTLRLGHTYTVTWHNQDPRVMNYSVNLEFVANGSYFIVLPLGIVSSEKESLAFTIPPTIPPKTNYQIYFSNASNINDVIAGSQAFTIK